MKRINLEYANRVTSTLNKAIDSLGDSELANDLANLRDNTRHTLSLTCQEEEALRSDTRRYSCEQSTKHEELIRLEKKLAAMQEEREERRTELQDTLSEIKTQFDSRYQALVREQDEKSEEAELETQRIDFKAEYEALQTTKSEASKQSEEQQSRYANEESQLLTTISSLKSSLHQLSSDHEESTLAKQTQIEELQGQFEQENKRRIELEEHFKRVDLDNARKKAEDDKINEVSIVETCELNLPQLHVENLNMHISFQVLELEKKAEALLDNGATGLQKLWRGLKDRKLVSKMKSKKKKGKSGKKKKKK